MGKLVLVGAVLGGGASERGSSKLAISRVHGEGTAAGGVRGREICRGRGVLMILLVLSLVYGDGVGAASPQAVRSPSNGRELAGRRVFSTALPGLLDRPRSLRRYLSSLSF